jgi:hypothetical protein
MGRISIAATLGWVVLFAVGMAALVNASEFWVGVTFHLTIGAILTGVVGLILRGRRGGGWLGFAVFGSCYFLLYLLGASATIRSMSDPVATWAFEKANRRPAVPASVVPGPTASAAVPAVDVPAPPVFDPSSPSLAPAPAADVGAPPAPVPPTMPDSSAGIAPVPPVPPEPSSDPMEDYREAVARFEGRLEHSKTIGSLLLTLAFAGLGAFVGTVIARSRPSDAGPPP